VFPVSNVQLKYITSLTSFSYTKYNKEDYCLLASNITVYGCWLPTFWTNMPPPFQGEEFFYFCYALPSTQMIKTVTGSMSVNDGQINCKK
jgi:hypothetical protein